MRTKSRCRHCRSSGGCPRTTPPARSKALRLVLGCRPGQVVPFSFSSRMKMSGLSMTPAPFMAALSSLDFRNFAALAAVFHWKSRQRLFGFPGFVDQADAAQGRRIVLVPLRAGIPDSSSFRGMMQLSSRLAGKQSEMIAPIERQAARLSIDRIGKL